MILGLEALGFSHSTSKVSLALFDSMKHGQFVLVNTPCTQTYHSSSVFDSCLALLDWSPSHLQTWMVEQELVFKEEEILLFKGLCPLHCISGLF